MRIIEAEGKGVILYIPEHEGRGIGILNKLRAYRLQDEGEDTIEANLDLGFPSDLRDFGIGAQVLADLGLRKLRLMTNNPKKLVGLSGWGLELVERVPLEVAPNEHNLRYLETKRERMGHSLELGEHREERV
jgi:3,4-dihydroxy 2-butanone 4-phosphate synthase/GTP cyclohydrolase II